MSRKPVYWEDLPYPAKRQVVDVVVRKSYVGPVLIGVGVVGAGVLVYWLLTRKWGKGGGGKSKGEQAPTGIPKRLVLEIHTDHLILDGQPIKLVDLIDRCKTWAEVEVKIAGDVLVGRVDAVLTPIKMANKMLKLVGVEDWQPPLEFDPGVEYQSCPDGYYAKMGGTKTSPTYKCIKEIVYS